MTLSTLLRPALLIGTLAMSVQVLAQSVELESAEARAGYSIGVNIGMNLESQGIASNVDVDALMSGIADGLSGNLQLSEEQIVSAIEEFSQKLEAEAMAQVEQQSQAGQQFLAENATREGVMTTDSGLQYMVLEEGSDASAPSPAASDTVNVHYHGTLVDGTVFDSSVDRGEPITFPLNGVIPGWTEGLQLMQVGDKYRFFIPANLAYGEAGAGPIGPNSTLIFEVELLGIE
ncbi:MAG: FKBP-type peptidyl-prolyl cis-trans isomerase [Pseudohongiellaceae bacterium]